MTAITDLNDAVAALQAEVANAITDIQSLTTQISTANSANDPAIEDAVSKLKALADNLKAAVSPPTAPAATATGVPPSA